MEQQILAAPGLGQRGFRLYAKELSPGAGGISCVASRGKAIHAQVGCAVEGRFPRFSASPGPEKKFPWRKREPRDDSIGFFRVAVVLQISYSPGRGRGVANKEYFAAQAGEAVAE